MPERSIGASFASTDLMTHGFSANWDVDHQYNLCAAGGDKSKVNAFVSFMEVGAGGAQVVSNMVVFPFWVTEKVVYDAPLKMVNLVRNIL